MCKSTGAFGLAAILIAALSAAPFDGAQAKFTVLHSFTISNDGPGYPYAGLLRDSAGNLYGTTEISGAGTVFRLAPDGTFQVLHAFDGQDGAYPLASLIADDAGNLYGTTADGGSAECGGGGCGVAFKLAPDGTETVLHAFLGRDSDGDGEDPESALLMDDAGNLYGTTIEGGVHHRYQDDGSVFKIAPDGTTTILHGFRGPGDGSDGLFPSAGLIADRKGNLYGTTTRGGAYDGGAIFKISPRGKERLLHSFTGEDDGSGPSGGMLRDRDGNLYGTTGGGGAFAGGIVFKLASDGTVTVLHAFAGGQDDGAGPYGGLIADHAGNLYGTTLFGGRTEKYCPSGCGTIFKLAPDGSETILHKFSYDAGAFPNGVIIDEQGNFYGTTQQGGSDFYGTIFEFSPN